MSIDKELKILLKESVSLTHAEYCKTCHTEHMFCDDCRMEAGMTEPSEYLSISDLMLFCEYESHDYGDQ